MAISNKNYVEKVNLGKGLVPGKQLCKVNKISLQHNEKHKDKDVVAYYLILDLEGIDLTAQGFEGFFIDKDNESLGRHKGQTGRVKMYPYSFADGVTRGGKKVYRDELIQEYVNKLAKELGLFDEILNVEGKDIEEFVENANKVITSKEVFINFVIAGRPYTKGKYTQFNLYLPETKKDDYGKKTFESADVLPENSKLLTFDPKKHIEQEAKKAVESFGDTDDVIDTPSTGGYSPIEEEPPFQM